MGGAPLCPIFTPHHPVLTGEGLWVEAKTTSPHTLCPFLPKSGAQTWPKPCGKRV